MSIQQTIAAKPFGIQLVVAFMSGAIYVLGLAPVNFWPAIFFSIITLYLLLFNKSPKESFWLAYCYGVGFFGAGVSWVHVSIHEFGHAPLTLSILLTFLFVFFLGLFKGAVGWLSARISHRFGQVNGVLSFAVIWIVFDWFQASFLTGFPWLFAGYGFVGTWWDGWAKILGVYGLSFVIVFQSVMVAWLILHPLKRHMVIAISLMVGGLVIAGGADHYGHTGLSASKTASIALVQPNIPQQEKWKRENLMRFIQRYDSMTQPYWQSDLIVWPEAAIPAVKHRVEAWLERWDQAAEQHQSNLLLGIPVVDLESKKIYASMLALGHQEARYDKQHLVPFGEFVPLEQWLRGIIEFLDMPMSSFTPGSTEQKAIQINNWAVLPAICYEIAYSGLLQGFSKDLNNQLFPIIVTISNDAWFGRSWGPHQHLQIAQMRALENGIPLLRSTNTGITVVVDHQGTIVHRIEAFKQGVLSAEVNFTFAQTLYSKYGFSLLLVAFITFVLLLYFPLARGLKIQ
ncbi:apolipoprotein N-acyltransferase [Pleionea sp. CnH1-48]|uniref:apolipoprotein N-acyltransferase n=1 Tax=Pleionea sp. CnH1-48 TaxID=2954494 RepID=UPI0020981F9E|nr:apolipoprotein N-acyltransferase [Pleionea sp. CnH1-48]MCO7225026.1 apolipoprotein N-acyltransferase [Pleionea sp. CnH1-48]